MTSVHTHKQGYYNINGIFLMGGKKLSLVEFLVSMVHPREGDSSL